MERLVNLINTTELNTVVLDVKEDGKVNYASEVESVKKIGAYHELYNVDEVIKLLHDNNIYVIGRIVCFRDNYLAGKRVDLAIKRKDGFDMEGKRKYSVDKPIITKRSGDTILTIAKEAVKKGFDEIQFDYVRFPAAGKNEVDYGEILSLRLMQYRAFLKKRQVK